MSLLLHIHTLVLHFQCPLDFLLLCDRFDFVCSGLRASLYVALSSRFLIGYTSLAQAEPRVSSGRHRTRQEVRAKKIQHVDLRRSGSNVIPSSWFQSEHTTDIHAPIVLRTSERHYDCREQRIGLKSGWLSCCLNQALGDIYYWNM